MSEDEMVLGDSRVLEADMTSDGILIGDIVSNEEDEAIADDGGTSLEVGDNSRETDGTWLDADNGSLEADDESP